MDSTHATSYFSLMAFMRMMVLSIRASVGSTRDAEVHV